MELETGEELNTGSGAKENETIRKNKKAKVIKKEAEAENKNGKDKIFIDIGKDQEAKELVSKI